MDPHRIALERTGLLPKLVQDHLEDAASLRPFRAYPPSEEGYEHAIEDRSLGNEARGILVDRIKSQYDNAGVQPSSLAKEKIEALEDPHTYTVTTGHQLCLFSGPLLYVHKILQTIRLSEELAEKYPGRDFVPVHWMASEDHDLPEVDHVVMNGEKLQWGTEQEGPVGRMKPEGLDSLIEKIEERVEELPYGQQWVKILKRATEGARNLSQLTRDLLNELFGERGLVVIDGDDPTLKAQFRQDLEKELTDKRSQRCVERTDRELEDVGYDLQVRSRSINLFYLLDGYRERIEASEAGYATADGKYRWSHEEVLTELREAPERFSPNVILRPLYQERILPNIAYLGGPAEIAYWHQLKGLFEEAGAFFPLLQLRSQIYHIDPKDLERMEKSGIRADDLFRNKEELIQERVKASSSTDLELHTEEEELRELYERLGHKAASIDPNLWDSIMSEKQKAQKGLDRSRKKMIRHSKKSESLLVDRIQQVHEKLFPDGTPQERIENIAPFYARDGERFLDRTEKALDPARAEALLIVEKEA